MTAQNSNPHNEKVIIIGDVGSMAGAVTNGKIIEETMPGLRDQEQLSVFLLSRSSWIPDRTVYLQRLAYGKNDIPHPGLAMAKLFAAAARALEPGECAVGGVPCDTFHAPAIYDHFADAVARSGAPIKILSMLEETLALLKATLNLQPDADGGNLRIGILSTTGTRMTRIFDILLMRHGFEPVYIDEKLQPALHESIYHPEWGLKSLNPPSREAEERVWEMADQLVKGGVAALIPASTELPLVLTGKFYNCVPLVDPVQALARALIREANPAKLKPLG
ncbi:MAG: aspartate/glutamate racemase family protein [Planctomycetes bacterium]|nr:aspartate/glutamate racemase family protein [Planctomycetota bacterium]